MLTAVPKADRAKTWRRFLIVAALCFLAGVVGSIVIAWVLAYVQKEPEARATYSAVEGDERREVAIHANWVMQRVTMTRTYGLSWAPQRAIGPPDTNRMGDIPTAWASLSADGQAEWLELDYAPAVSPRMVRVYENYGPGALIRIELFDTSGRRVDTWTGKDPAEPTQTGVCVAEIPLGTQQPVSRIRLHLDSINVRDWNEIDAVGLVDPQGQVHWATAARASSTYATQSAPALADFDELNKTLPGWFQIASRPWGPPPNQVVETAVREARGWPANAMWVELPISPVATQVYLPMRPILSGLLMNGGFYAILMMGLYASTVGLRRFVRESLRLRRGWCMKCGYDLRFDLAGGCPECGWRRD